MPDLSQTAKEIKEILIKEFPIENIPELNAELDKDVLEISIWHEKELIKARQEQEAKASFNYEYVLKTFENGETNAKNFLSWAKEEHDKRSASLKTQLSELEGGG